MRLEIRNGFAVTFSWGETREWSQQVGQAIGAVGGGHTFMGGTRVGGINGTTVTMLSLSTWGSMYFGSPPECRHHRLEAG